MKRFLLFFSLVLLLYGCDNRVSDPDNEIWSRVQVYENGTIIHDEVLDEADDKTFTVLYLQDESQLVLDKFVNILYSSDPSQDEEEIDRDYNILVEKQGYFTRFYSCSYQDTIIIDAISGYSLLPSNVICGVIFDQLHYPYLNSTFYVLQDSVIIDSITTNGFGHFTTSLSFGNYKIINGEYYLLEEVEPDDFDLYNFYDDFIVTLTIVGELKPNIYLYPEKDICLNVSLSFPKSGSVTTSIPDYGNGWRDLNIDSTGRINDKFDFLFYESMHPDLFQTKSGWIVLREDLETFFIENLILTGFEGQEIADFIDYWIPLLKDYPYYAIYPQYIDQLNQTSVLEFSIEPDNLLRLNYFIDGLQDAWDSANLKEPIIPVFERKGFTVVEWGVSLRNGTLLTLNK